MVIKEDKDVTCSSSQNKSEIEFSIYNNLISDDSV